MPYEGKDPQIIFTIFRKCLQCFKNLFTIFLKTLVSVAEERIAKEGKTMLAPVFHIFVELATPKMQTRVFYAIYHETKAKIVKAIVVSRSEARGSSSNGILVGDQMSKCQFTF